MASSGEWWPGIDPQPDGSFLFKLQDDIGAHVRPDPSNKKQTLQMWRKETVLLCGSGHLREPDFRKKIIKLARDQKEGFNAHEERDENGNVTYAAGANRIP